MTTSWMWQSGQGVKALRIDRENRIMRWFDFVGCGCGMEESAIEQSLADYIASGPPTMLAPPPDDVVMEIEEAILQLAIDF